MASIDEPEASCSGAENSRNAQTSDLLSQPDMPPKHTQEATTAPADELKHPGAPNPLSQSNTNPASPLKATLTAANIPIVQASQAKMDSTETSDATQAPMDKLDYVQALDSSHQPETVPTSKQEATLPSGEKVYIQVPDPSSTGWPAMFKTVRDSDVAKADDCKEDIDTLLVFAGLYSAVLSAFLVESYKSLQEDTQEVIAGLLRKMAMQNYVLNGRYLNSTTTLPPPEPFAPPLWAIRVNVLWFTSLILSLAVASLGMLVKQWLREYLALEDASPQQRLRARQYRQPALKAWKVYEIAAALPVILQISLALFFLGLCFFTAAVHESVRKSTIPVVCAWAFFFVVTTIAPLFSPRCPFKTTFLKSTMKVGRRYVGLPLRMVLSSTALHLWRAKHRRLNPSRDTTSNQPQSRSLFRFCDELHPEEDQILKSDVKEDSEILLSVDAIRADDAILPTMFDVLQKQRNPDPCIIMNFVLEIIGRRIGTPIPKDRPFPVPDLSELSKAAWSTLSTAIADLLTLTGSDPLAGKSPIWALNGALILLGRPKEDLPDTCVRVAEEYIIPRIHSLPAAISDTLLERHITSGGAGMHFIHGLILFHTGINLSSNELAAIPDLRKLPKEVWDILVGYIVRILERYLVAPLTKDSPAWALDAVLVLLGRPKEDLPDDGVRVVDTYVTPHITSLPATMLNILRRERITSGDSGMHFIRDLILIQAGNDLTHDGVLPLDLRGLSDEAWVMLVGGVASLLEHHTSVPLTETSLPWEVDAALMLLGRPRKELPDAGVRVVDTYITPHISLLPATMLDILHKQRILGGDTGIRFILLLMEIQTGVDLTSGDSRAIQNLQWLSDVAWVMLATAVVKLLELYAPEELPEDIPGWAVDGFIMLLSQSKYDLPAITFRTLRKYNTPRIFEAIEKQRCVSPTDNLLLILRSISIWFQGKLTLDKLTPVLDLRGIPELGWNMLATAVSELVERHPPTSPTHSRSGWVSDGLIVLLSRANYSPPQIGVQMLRKYLTPDIVDAFSKQQFVDPGNAMHIIRRSISAWDLNGVDLPHDMIPYILNLHTLSEPQWISLVTAASELLGCHAANLTTENSPEWVLDAGILLLSKSKYALPPAAADTLHTLILKSHRFTAAIRARLAQFNTSRTRPSGAVAHMRTTYVPDDTLAGFMHICTPLLCRRSHCDHHSLSDLLHLHIDDIFERPIHQPREIARKVEIKERYKVIIDDLFTAAATTLNYAMARENEREAMHVLLQLSRCDDYETHAIKVVQSCLTDAFGTHLGPFLSIHPCNRAGTHCERLFVEALVGFDEDKRRRFIKITLNELEKSCFSLRCTIYRGSDLVRFCLLLLRACERTAALPMPSTSPATSQGPLRGAWLDNSFWEVFAGAIGSYHKLEEWKYETQFPPWRKNDRDVRVITSDEALKESCRLAGNCLEIIKRGTVQYPTTLGRALSLFAGMEADDTGGGKAAKTLDAGS